MKTRSGFVSNSSSSSFVVPRKKDFCSKRKILSAGDERGLKKLGFSLQMCYYPEQVVENDPKPKTKLEKALAKETEHCNWCRTVTCNQEDEIYFLLKARIGFLADVHYGHYSIVYDGKTDEMIIAQNYGIQAMMAGEDKMNFKPWRVPGIEYTTGKKYLEKTNKLRV